MSRVRTIGLVISAVLALALVAPLAAQGQSGVGEQSVVTELRSANGKVVVLSIPMVTEGMVAFASWTRADVVVVDATTKVLPFAEIQMFVASRPKEGTSAPVTFVEVPDFGKAALRLRFTLPDKERTAWFRGAGPAGAWHSVNEIAKGGVEGYALKIVEDQYPTLVIDVFSWPPGDPTLGWGPRPKI
jgi:hypothetical protein